MMTKKIAIMTICLVLWGQTVSAQVLSAQVANTKVPQGEVFNLNLSYDGADGDSLQPDLSVLQKDFTIYSTSSSSQVSIINGRTSQQRDWDIGLMPKNQGKIVIPEITAGKYKTKPLELEVLPAGTNVAAKTKQANIQSDNQLADAAKFEAELEVEKNNVYLQQEVNATLTIKDRIGLELSAEPQFIASENWIVKSLKQPEIIKKGQEREIKFYYALFPQKSGKNEVPAIKISGSYLSADNFNKHPLFQQGVNGFLQIIDVDVNDMFGLRKPVEFYTKPVTVDVLPAQLNDKENWWLPASGLSLTAKWTDKNPEFKVGETIAREITLVAMGVADSQLPELYFPDNPNFKQYPEKPQLTTDVYNNRIISQEVVRVVYIPQQSGEQILPEIKLPWFNTQTQKTETAVIPAEKIKVEGGSLAQEPQAQIQSVEKVSEKTKVKDEKTKIVSKGVSLSVLFLFVGAAFVFGLLISLLFRRSDNQTQKECQTSHSFYLAIKRNLAEADYRSLRDNLLGWGNEVYKSQNIRNLQDLSKVVAQDDFSNQLEILNKILYAGASEKLNTEIILRVIKTCQKKQNGKSHQEPLPKLYK